MYIANSNVSCKRCIVIVIAERSGAIEMYTKLVIADGSAEGGESIYSGEYICVLER